MTGTRVLVVEHDEDLRQLLIDCLGERGFEAAGAADGTAALAYLDVNPRPGAIILDMQVRPMTGLEFLDRKRARRDLDPVPVFAASAAEPPAGVARAFPKPFDLEDLIEALSEFMQR